MSSHSHDHTAVAPAEVLDPVCGMTISPDDAVGHVDHKGRTYYFCSQSCVDQFRATPDAFLGERIAVAATPADMEREYTCPMDPEVRQNGPGACPKCGMALEPVDVAPVTKVEWTCPMHPEIVRDAPGACPICGMALEPRTVTLEEKNPELDDMTHRFRWSAVMTAPILAFMVSEFLPGHPLQTMLPHGWLNWILFALATPVVLWGGWPFFVRGWASVVNRYLNMFTLIALGVGAAYAFSVVATMAPGLFPDSFRMNGSVAVYFEPAAVIVVLVLLGQVLELRARSRTGAAIRNLLGLAPKTARRIRQDGTELDVPLEHVVVNDRLRVRPGERVPVDGVLLEGTTTIDESMVTGEPIPVEKTQDAKVTGGTAIPCAHSAARRHGGGLVRADRHRRLGGHVHRLGRLWAGAATGSRTRQCGRCLDHRVPLRTRSGDAHVDHGRYRPGCRRRRTHSQRRVARDPRAHEAQQPRRSGSLRHLRAPQGLPSLRRDVPRQGADRRRGRVEDPGVHALGWISGAPFAPHLAVRPLQVANEAHFIHEP